MPRIRPVFILVLLYTFSCVESVVPSGIPYSRNGHNRNELIKIYFMEGLKYAEIVRFLLCHHNIILSIRHLKRTLRSLNLRGRPYRYSSVHDIMNIVKEQMKGSGERVGIGPCGKDL